MVNALSPDVGVAFHIHLLVLNKIGSDSRKQFACIPRGRISKKGSEEL
jgi:hypothetical protein